MIGLIPQVAPRSLYATDFAEFAKEAQLSSYGWTKRSASDPWYVRAGSAVSNGIGGPITGMLSDRLIVAPASNNDVMNITLDDLDGAGSSDFDILVLMRRDNFSPNTPALMGVMRTDNAGNEGVDFGMSTTSRIEVAEFQGGLYQAGTDTNFGSISKTSWYWLRFTRVGNVHTGKMWLRGSDESTAVSVSRTTTRTGGNLGLMCVNSDAHFYAWFSAATGTGKRAPGPQG